MCPVVRLRVITVNGATTGSVSDVKTPSTLDDIIQVAPLVTVTSIDDSSSTEGHIIMLF